MSNTEQGTKARAGYRRDQIRRGLSSRTIEERDRVLDSLTRHAEPLTATREDIDEWLDSLALCPRSRACYLSTAHNFYQWAVDEEWRDDDPTRKIMRPRLRRLLPRPLDEEALQLAIRLAPPRMRAWLSLAGFQGFRCKEIAGLRSEDVLSNRRQPVLLVNEGKGGHQAVLPLNEETLRALRVYGLPKRGYVFISERGRPFNPRTVSIYSAAYLRSLGIDGTLHQARHRYGTAVWARTKDLRVTQELLRHANPASSAGYAAYDRDLAAQAIANIHEFHA